MTRQILWFLPSPAALRWSTTPVTVAMALLLQGTALSAQALPGLEAQTVHRPATAFRTFDIHGINTGMTAEAARTTLIAEGFTEKSPDRWGKVPTATFEQERITVAISHLEGTISAIVKNQLWTGESELDISEDLEHIRSHFNLSGDDAQACKVAPYGTQCGLNDGASGGNGLVASLTPQMIFIRVDSRR